MNVDNHGPGSIPPSSFTVLRIKRKATEPALNSLVIQDQARTKRRRDIAGRPRGVFRLADTVPGTWLGEGREGEVLKTRIQDLLASKTSRSPTSPAPVPVPSPVAQNVPQHLPRNESFSSAPQLPHVAEDRRTSQSHAHQMQYRVVPPISPRTKSMLPPRLITNEESERGQKPFVFVDAHAIAASEGKSTSAVEDKEMAAFLPMLEEYLRLEAQEKEAEQIERDNDWVYDLYYRDNTTSAPLDLGMGDGVTIGQLLGFEDYSPPSSVSGSEPEDEADEDSNDEDYYRNDYPEDEDADEDMVGYRAGGDSDWSEEDAQSEDDEGRNEWGYR